MSSTPSRSEIETALSGRTKRKEANARRPQRPTIDLEVPPRRQQVIGGDLTGISSRPRKGLFSRYGDISLSYWFAGAMAVLILLAFFWPQSSDPTLEVTEAQAKTQSDLISSIEPIEQTDDAEVLVSSFTRDSDLERANEFRERDENNAKIQKLLDDAKGFAAKGQFTQPAKQNALASYTAVLAIEPKNVTARQGLEAIRERFLNAGLAALEQSKEKVAQSALSKLALIDKSSDQYEDLSVAIESWRTGEQVDELLKKAARALSRDRLILPANTSALFFYREALKIDAESKPAQEGIERIADTYIERANKEVVDGEYKAAAAHLATVSVIDPNHSSISVVEELISKARPIAQKAEQSNDVTDVKDEAAAAVPEVKQELSEEPDVDTDAVARSSPSEPETQPTILPPSAQRTPSRQANEQADFDRQYLKQGLEAYYKGQYETAAALLQPLADKGVARAQFRLAYMHYLGRGFKRDRQEADRRIRAALPAIRKFADEGRAWAQSDIGSLYEDGLVLPRDFGEAVYWYRSAAEQGYPGAQTNLGLMYARGRGVSSSRRTAIQWFQRAAKQGDDVARRNLKALGVN